MANKIFGVDFTDSTDPQSTWTTSIHNGAALRDVALSSLHKALQVPTKYVGKTSAPTAFSDTSAGYKVGDLWVDETNDKAYVALDVTASAAIWVLIPTLASTPKGRVEMMAAIPPTASGAPLNVLAGASSPAEQFPYYEFVNGSVTYRDFLCRLVGYNGGGLTVSFQVMRTSGAAAATYIFDAAIRRIASASEDLGASQTYDYNTVTVTIPAGPPAAGIPMAGTITFTDGADMDSLADGDFFVLRFRRNGGTATDTARVLAAISAKES